MKKKKENETPKKKVNPLHKDYKLTENLKFIFGHTFREEKALYVLIPLGILCAPVMEYLWTFMSTQILRLAELEKQWQILLPVCGVFF